MRPTTWTCCTTTLCLLFCLHLSGSTYYERDWAAAANRDGLPNRWIGIGDPESGHRRPSEQHRRGIDGAGDVRSMWTGSTANPSSRRSNIVNVDDRRDQRQATEDRTPNKKNDGKRKASSGGGGDVSSTVRSGFWGAQNVTTARPTTTSRGLTSPRGQVDRSHTPSVTYWIDRPTVDRAIKQIPVTILLELRNITNPVDFLNRYVVEASDTRNTVQSGRNHSFVSSIMRERTLSAPFAHAAGCTPQPTTVPVQMDTRSDPEPYVMYFPSCTRIERCDGCCNTDLLECQPIKTEMATLQVLRVKYLGPNVNKFDISEPVIVELERHLQCDCQCRIKESDCRFYQTYRPNECRCECSNQHESVDCVGERLWDPHTCQCRCRHQHDCSTGYFFNDQTCICETMRTRSKPAFRGF